MKKVYAMPDLVQLKKWKTYDQEGYNFLVSAIEKRSKILVLGTFSSGKNTMQHSIVDFIHRTHEAILVVPPIENVNLNKMGQDKELKKLKSLCQAYPDYIACIQHSGDADFEIEEYISQFDGWFDCVLDMRKLDDERKLCNIYAGKNKLKRVYSNKDFVKFYKTG